MKRDRVIYHIDVNSAFLSWEAVYRMQAKKDKVDLRDIPSIIGGDEKLRHGIVLAKSIPAKRFGIKTGESIRDALAKCPQLVICPPCYNLYERCSKAMRKEFEQYSPVIEKYSVDECFIDMTETIGLFGDPIETAYELKDKIKDRLGFTVNIGVAPNKLLAKMASDFEKPDKVHTLFYDEIPVKMWPLPVEDLFFVGRSTRKKLHNLGIFTIGQLAQFDLELLKRHIGNKYGMTIHNYANGIDDSLVEAEESMNKGYGNSTTLSRDVTQKEEGKKIILSLVENVASRLRKDGVKADCICLELKTNLFHSYSHQKTLDGATDITNDIYKAAVELFDEMWQEEPLRLIGVRATGITEDAYQFGLFDYQKKEKLQNMDKAVDAIRRKFGKDAVKRASFLKGDIDHMTGGISRKKQEGIGEYLFESDN
ncbi:MAG: DNA polymerase IV [Lachnospiraceae bacterium]|nr:DNA polymerase IV [Lachnospiraceae bacterium]